MKKLIPSYVRVPLIFALVMGAMEYFIDSGDKPAFIEYPMVSLFLGVFLFLLIAIEIVVSAVDKVTYHLLTEEQKKQLEEAQSLPFTEGAFYQSIMKKLTRSKEIEEEHDVMLDHDYDGIKELDNVLPPWWVNLFYLTIIFAFVYLVRNGIINWAPTFLQEAKNYTQAEAAWASGGYELAAIPGTLLCGIMSDKLFKGRRAPVTIIYMFFTLLGVIVYWKTSNYHLLQNLSLWGIGFFIYGPVMLIGVQAIDLVPKKAAGTAAGLTGLFGYFIGDLLANAALGGLVDSYGWDACFITIAISSILAIFFTAFTWNREKKNLANLTPLSH